MPTPNEFEMGVVKPQVSITFLLDTSGSMYGESINQLNVAMAEAIEVAKESAKVKEKAQLMMRVIEFNSSAEFIFGDTENGVSDIEWKDLTASGSTDTAGALKLARTIMHTKYLGTNNYQPIVILITDGESDDREATKKAIEELKNSLKSRSNPEKDKIMRIALGVKGANQQELEDFASEGTIIYADDPEKSKENAKLVFNVADVQLLKELLKSITKSSISSSLGGSKSDKPVIEFEEDSEDEDLDMINDPNGKTTNPDGSWVK